MYIIDTKNGNKLNDIILYLTPEEMFDMKTHLDSMLKPGIDRNRDHVHIDNWDYTTEVTIAFEEMYRGDQ